MSASDREALKSHGGISTAEQSPLRGPVLHFGRLRTILPAYHRRRAAA